MDFFEFKLTENSISDPKLKPVVHNIKIQLPLTPDAFGDIMKFLADDNTIQAGRIIIEQYMWTAGENKAAATKLQERILKDGRLLMSCTVAITPLLNLCQTEVKKN